MTCVASLPDYIKDIYKELLHVYEEAEEELAKDGRDYRIRYGIDKVPLFSYIIINSSITTFIHVKNKINNIVDLIIKFR